MNRFSQFSVLFVGFFIGLVFFVSAATDNVQVNLNVNGCNNNSICEAVTGEDAISCPNDCSVPPTPTGGGGGGSAPVQFVYSVTVNPQISSGLIHFKTQTPVFATVRWGKTVEYNDGIIRSTVYVTDHTFNITELNSATVYYFVIEYQDRNARPITSYNSSFATLSFPEPHHIPNPLNVRSTVSKQGVMLRWNNPINPDFDYIRIMRSTDRFHSDPFVGSLIYEGSLGYFLDRNVVRGRTYYYTLFTRETSGEFSSGVGVSTLFDFGEDAPIVLPPPPIQAEEFLPNFLVIQKGQIISSVRNVREVTGSDTVQAQSMPGTFAGFDDIWAEVTNPSKNDTRAYLFKYDTQKKIYTTSISPLFTNGDYEIRIYGFNQDHTVLLSEGILRVSDIQVQAIKPANKDWVVLFWLLLTLVLILWFKKRLNQ